MPIEGIIFPELDEKEKMEEIIHIFVLYMLENFKAVARGGATGACAPPFKKKNTKKIFFPL